MPAIILESKLGSAYDDSPTSYEFPARYLSYFEPLKHGEPIYAVIYEPRGDRSAGPQGRMMYVGWAEIRQPPRLSGNKSRQGGPLWRVDYHLPAQTFDVAVPRESNGIPLESWLRPFARGRDRNSKMRGRAVRALPWDEFELIMNLGHAEPLERIAYSVRDEHLPPLEIARERSTRIVDALTRDAKFRTTVLSAYGYQCLVSGFELGRVSKTKPQGLLDAAHIRPVSENGPDDVSNGVPLTPTLHRLFDTGFFTIEYNGGLPTVLTSPLLEPRMLVGREGDFRLPLKDGLPLLIPSNSRHWPSPEQLRFHRRHVFQAEAG